MTMEPLILIVCFLGALVQITTGLGFGLIVAPMLLAFYEPVDAIQMTGALTLLIVAGIAPFVRRRIMPYELTRLAIGTLAGLVVGSALLLVASINAIRVAALMALAYCLVRYVTVLLQGVSPAVLEPVEPVVERASLFYGMASGVMSATLAMPGPLALVFLRSRGLNPARVRATVFALMVGSYSGMLIISVTLSGLSDTVLAGITVYLLPTLTGVVLGQLISDRLPDLFFDVMTTLLMIFTLLVLGLKIIDTGF